MHRFAALVLEQQRLFLTVAVLLAVSGALAFGTMNRQEDPFFPNRAGLITVPFPGADPERIERLVVRHLEEEIQQVESVNTVRSTTRANVALITVELRDAIYDTQSAWERVRQAMDRAALKFPPEAAAPTLDDELIATSTVVLAVTGDDDPMVLADAAELIRHRLLALPNIQSIDLIGDPGEQLTIAIDEATAWRMGLSPGSLANQLGASNRIIPGGTLRVDDTTVVLRPESEFLSLEEIRNTPIRLPGGDLLPLGSFARVWRGPAEPAQSQFYFNGQRAVGIDIVTVPDATNQVRFGEQLRTLLDELTPRLQEANPAFADLRVDEVFFQPDRVHQRLRDLSTDLALAMVIILVVLFSFMGLRLSLVVSVVLPLVTAVTVAIYAMNGQVLHQIAVIGLIIALGILIDNAIVVVENIQWRLNQGATRQEAAAQSVRELIGPLGAATGTTLAAFVPMLLAKGGTGDFTRAIPVTIMTALAMSYLAAMTVTPIIAARFLRPRSTVSTRGQWPEAMGRLAGGLATRRPGRVFLFGALLVGLSFFMARWVDAQFFPNADRNQIVVDFTLPEGTALPHTLSIATVLEEALRADPDVQAVHGFVGDSGPRFYYNVPDASRDPRRGRLVVETSGLDGNLRVIERIRAFALAKLPEVELIAKQLAQGPPINAPIEVRVFHPDPKPLAVATQQVYAAIKSIPGVVDARHDLGLGVPSVSFEILSAVASDYGLSRADVAQALLGRSTGLTVGSYRAGDEPVPIRLRSADGERYPLAQLAGVNVYSPAAGPIPLSALVQSHVQWQPAAIRHRDGRRLATVSSELDPAFVYTEVLDALRPKLAELNLPAGVEIAYGGESETSGEANAALLTTAPFGLMLLLFFLLLQFNSFKRVAIVMMTVPLAAVGVIPGLVLTDSPFGFQPLLGIIALVGIVVNNAIVLIDVIDQQLDRGEPLAAAVRAAVERRTRPILLTTATTIAGLLPLAFSGTTLWPPMAWAIISGLAASAFLTLFVVPATCSLWLKSEAAHA